MPVTFDRVDLDFILKQIEMAEAGQPPVSPHLAFGLRELLGTDNNTQTGIGGPTSTFGAADQSIRSSPRNTFPAPSLSSIRSRARFRT
jgi:hypothetical protein